MFTEMRGKKLRLREKWGDTPTAAIRLQPLNAKEGEVKIGHHLPEVGLAGLATLLLAKPLGDTLLPQGAVLPHRSGLADV